MIQRFKDKFIGSRAFYVQMLGIAVPIMIQNGITNFVGLLDNIMVGQLGTEQMSGVSIVNQLLFVYNLCIFGGLAGAGMFTAQYFGLKDNEGIRHTFRYKIWLGLSVTLAAFLIFFLWGDKLIELYLNGSSNGGNLRLAFDCGVDYLRIILLGLPPFVLLQVYASTLRACGETKVPMRAGMTAVLVNLALNYLLIFGRMGFPCLGARGAAIATVLSRYVELCAVAVWTHRHREENPYIVGIYRTLRVPAVLVEKYFVKGIPLLINEGLWSGGTAVVAQCYSLRGLTIVAGLNIANTIHDLFNVSFQAMGESVAIIVGQLLGAGKMREARDTDNKMIAFVVLSSFGIALVMLAIAPLFPQIYRTDAEVRAAAAGFIAVQAAFLPQNAFLNTTYFTLQAGGKTWITFIYDCVCIWGISVPLAFVLSRYTGLDAHLIYAFVGVGEWAKCLLGFVMVRKGVWLQNIVSDPQT
ncbi:putative FMN/FAD exporter YeeO [Lachnospiraceae bacterium]|nr:putative FMN/FAD exporter YeeO [Lachnospiraceae bacterium]